MTADDLEKIRGRWIDCRLRTHYENCFLSHYECAIKKLIERIKELEEINSCLREVLANDFEKGEKR